jgi:hypothetical protein
MMNIFNIGRQGKQIYLPLCHVADQDDSKKGGNRYENGTVYPGDCRQLCPDLASAGPSSQSVLALVHGLCRAEPIAIRFHEMVYDGISSGKVRRFEG